jgi:KUP system potassium uptake protein
MFITTTLIAVQMAYVKRLPWAVTIAFIIFFGFVEGLFFGATISKVWVIALRLFFSSSKSLLMFKPPTGSSRRLVHSRHRRCLDHHPLLLHLGPRASHLASGFCILLFIHDILTATTTLLLLKQNLESTYDSSNTLQLSRIIFRSPHLSSPRLHVGHLPNVHSAKVAGRPATSSEIQEEGVDDGPFFPPSTLDERLWLAPFAHEDDEHGGESDVSLKKRTNRLELPRISAVAVFHKSSSSIVGVPSSFYAFLRRWPSLPRVVIFLSTRVVGLAHVDFQDRYSISKVRSLEGPFIDFLNWQQATGLGLTRVSLFSISQGSTALPCGSATETLELQTSTTSFLLCRQSKHHSILKKRLESSSRSPKQPARAHTCSFIHSSHRTE